MLRGMDPAPDAIRSITHDMRNLLTAVRGHAELALRGISSEDPAREDIAHVVAFLCSDFARHVTGQVIRVDGGQYI